MPAHDLTGGCHCGNIRYHLRTRLALEELPLRACGCSFCSRHGARYTSDPDSALAVEIAGEAQPYRFATKVVDFMVCRRCGILVFASTRIDDHDYAAINVNTLDDAPAGTAVAKDFSAETPEQSAARRKRNWIADVTVTTPAR